MFVISIWNYVHKYLIKHLNIINIILKHLSIVDIAFLKFPRFLKTSELFSFVLIEEKRHNILKM